MSGWPEIADELSKAGHRLFEIDGFRFCTHGQPYPPEEGFTYPAMPCDVLRAAREEFQTEETT